MTDVATRPKHVSALAGHYRALTLGALMLISLTAFESLAVATAMPAAASALNGLSLYALATGGLLASSVVGMVISGGWSDAKGPALPVWHGLAWFIVGLAASGLAPTMWILVLGRISQGFGAGLLTVALYVVVGHAYPPDLHKKVFAWFSGAWVIPSIVGPAISGLITDQFGWRWVFLAIPAFALPSALLLRPGLRRVDRPLHSDTDAQHTASRHILYASGAALSLLALHLGGQHRQTAAIILLAAAAVGVVVFAHRLLPTGTLRVARGLPTVVALRGLAGAAFAAADVFVPLMLFRERGLSPAMAGLTLTISALTWFVGSWYQGRPHQPLSPVHLLQLGMTFIGLGAATVGLTLSPHIPTFVAILGWGIAGLGMGLIFPTVSVLTLQLSAPGEQGANGSALQVSESLFSATTLALAGSLFAALGNSGANAYLACFAIAITLAVTGAVIAPRTRCGDTT